MDALKIAQGAVFSACPQFGPSLMDDSARRETKLMRSRARQFGIESELTWDTGILSSSSTTSFVLAGGASVRNLTAKKYEHVRDHPSVSLNRWVVHSSFVPTVAMVETLDRGTWNALVSHAHGGHLRAVLATRFVYKAHMGPPVRRLPPSLGPFTYSYSSVPLLGRGQGATRRYFQLLLEYAWEEHVMTGPTSTSVERAIFLLALSGMKRIVLCGVDLSGPYWWEPDSGSARRPHVTERWALQKGKTSVRLLALAEALREWGGIELLLAEPQGPLHPALSRYEGWDV